MTGEMDARRWKQIRAVFDELVELDGPSQAERIATIVATDPALGSAVGELLAADGDVEARLAHVGAAVALAAPVSDDAQGDPDSDPLKIVGHTISHFSIRRTLASGGMGVVYLAQDTHLDRTVALKFPLPSQHVDKSTKARFLREARSVGALEHPNICSIFEAGETDEGHLFFAMPLYDGRTLKRRLAADGALAPSEAIAIACQVAAGLDVAHRAGIVHRDVKPGNVMLLADGGVKLLDFGLAQAPDLTVTGPRHRMGTVSYMSPEQIQGLAVDSRTDIWALGAMLYEMLAGCRPFAGEYDVSVAHAIVHSQPRLTIVAPHVPVPLANLVTRCLEKDPGNRPASAAELLRAFDDFENTSARALTRHRRRMQTLGAASVALAAVAVLTAAVVQFRGRQFADAPTIAVLPFENSGTAEQADFTDGLTDEVTGKLATVRGLTVIGRGSAATYKRTTKSALEIGRELGVAYLLEGIVSWTHDTTGRWRAEIRPSLVRTRDGTVQWSGEPLIVTPNDAFSAQAEIATKVVSAIGVEVDARDRVVLALAPTKNAAAYELYLRARVISRNAINAPPETHPLRRAAELLEKATRLDPTFAAGFAELAGVLNAQLDNGTTDSTVAPRYSAALRAALTLDRDLPEAQYVQGMHLWFVESRFEEGLAALARASAHAPSDARMLSMAGTFQLALGQTSEGFANVERTTVLDPRDRTSNFNAAFASWMFRRFGDAERHARRMVAAAPNDWAGHFFLVSTPLARGDTSAARVALQTALQSQGGTVYSRAELFWMLPRPLAEMPARLLEAAPGVNLTTERGGLVYYVMNGTWAREIGQAARAKAYFDSAAVAAQSPINRLSGRSGRVVRLASFHAVAFAGAGRSAEARRAIAYADSLERTGPLGNDPGMARAQDNIAYALLLLGDRDAALTRIERLLVLPSGHTPALVRAMWPYTSLHGDPRFERLTSGNAAH